MNESTEANSRSRLDRQAMRWFTTRVPQLLRRAKVFREVLRRDRDARGLRAMDDRELNDLGIGRGEIGYVMLGCRR